MRRTKKPKVQIKRERTSLGWAYRVYVDGGYMTTCLTLTAAHKCIPRVLKIYEKANSRALKSAIASSRVPE